MSGLDGLFTPRGVAVIGASRNPAKLGAVMARSLSTYDGPLALVNSRDSALHGSVAEAVDALGAPINLAVVCVPAPASADAVAEAAKAGATAALVCAGGFAEAGHPEYQEALAEVVDRYGIRLLGPNTSGFLVPSLKLTASFVPSAAEVPAGGVAVVAASGGVNHAVSFLLAEAGYGVSVAVGLGNSADVDATDVLEYLLDDRRTTAVALHIESVADGSRLAWAVARLSAVKPVVALVVGRNDVGEFAQSHTGALATSWRTTRGVLRQAGAVLVDDERQLVDAVGALSMTRLSANPDPGVGVVTAQAGPGLLLLDRLRGSEVRVPTLTSATQQRLGELLPPMTYQANPVDTGRPGPGFGEVVSVVGEDSAVDLVAVYALSEPDSLDLVSELSRLDGGSPTVVGVGGSSVDVGVVRSGLHERGFAVGTSPGALAHAVRALVDDAQLAYRRGVADEPVPAVEVPAGPWDEDQAKSVLDSLGIRTPARVACSGAEEAYAARDRLGGPVAVKILDAAVLHKTEIGGVHLGIRTRAELTEALEKLEWAGLADELAPHRSPRVLVEAMAPSGVDLIVGARRDPVFGPVVLVGLGGTTAEAFADVAVRAAPLSVAEASCMPDELLGRALLDGWRGGPVLDRSELARVVRALGAVLPAAPYVDEIEINPLRLTSDGLVALDAVITGKEQ
ncbi:MULTISPECIES: acetate--CoA ligase family protein [unclassified Kribbella]|uniref:acetate--CoA ligase family protein n=1 Tax=unclassified Kribbella TaxID=2644121 RepID=UPI003017ECCC